MSEQALKCAAFGEELGQSCACAAHIEKITHSQSLRAHSDRAATTGGSEKRQITATYPLPLVPIKASNSRLHAAQPSIGSLEGALRFPAPRARQKESDRLHTSWVPHQRHAAAARRRPLPPACRRRNATAAVTAAARSPRPHSLDRRLPVMLAITHTPLELWEISVRRGTLCPSFSLDALAARRRHTQHTYCVLTYGLVAPPHTQQRSS